MTRPDPTPPVSSRYGAPMGRRSSTFLEVDALDIDTRLTLVKIRLDRGGYDPGGAYWGVGAPLYYVADCDGNSQYFRAADRDDAKAQVRADFPGAKFYR